jgi:hypothetical protein
MSFDDEVDIGDYGPVLIDEWWFGRPMLGYYDDDDVFCQWDHGDKVVCDCPEDDFLTNAIVYPGSGVPDIISDPCESIPFSFLRMVPDTVLPRVLVSPLRGEWVYAIQPDPLNAPNRVKVGFSIDVGQRLRTYRTSNPTAQVVGVWAGTKAAEKDALREAAKCMSAVSREVFEGDVERLLARLHQLFSADPSP